MSDIKINGNTYSGVESIKLMKADNSGYATYKENAAETNSFTDILISGGYDIGDFESDDGSPNINWLTGLGGGTVSFPHATAANGAVTNSSFTNLLLPNVIAITSHRTADGLYPVGSKFSANVITGTLDLSSLTSIQNANQAFQKLKVGTLKLGALPSHNGIFSSAQITNLLWNISASITDSNVVTAVNTATSITNLYVPADRATAIQELVTAGTITKVTNVYSIDDWRD